MTAVNSDGQVFVDTVVSVAIMIGYVLVVNLAIRVPVTCGTSLPEFLILSKAPTTTRKAPNSY